MRRKRNEEESARKQRVAEYESKVNEEKEEQSKEKDPDDSTSEPKDLTRQSSIVPAARIPPIQNGHMQLLNHVSMPVLTPIPSSTVGETRKEKQSTINLAEFENFSTNPFEEMELKTLNDKAELALLLQPAPLPPTQNQSEQVQPTTGMPYSTFDSVGLQWVSTSQAAYQPLPHPTMQYSNLGRDWIQPNNVQPIYQQNVEEAIGRISLNNATTAPTTQGILRQAKSVPDLSDTVGLCQRWSPSPSQEASVASYRDKRLSSRTPPPRLSADAISRPIPRPMPNVESAVERNLRPDENYLIRQLSDMGFPRDLCARTVARVGGNEKDVLDQLLVIQKLEDKGHNRHRIESILELLKPKSEVLKVLEKHLVISEQLSDMGFDMEKIDSVLMTEGYDRDKAIDILVTM